jgi:hypothetical protein
MQKKVNSSLKKRCHNNLEKLSVRFHIILKQTYQYEWIAQYTMSSSFAASFKQYDVSPIFRHV